MSRGKIRIGAIGVLLAAAGCAQLFSDRAGRDVTREELLRMADTGTTDHLKYIGSDRDYHYVFRSKPGQEGTYRIPTDELPLKDTFEVGTSDSYILWPWLIEGKLLGTKPE